MACCAYPPAVPGPSPSCPPVVPTRSLVCPPVVPARSSAYPPVVPAHSLVCPPSLARLLCLLARMPTLLTALWGLPVPTSLLACTLGPPATACACARFPRLLMKHLQHEALAATYVRNR
jgi:hypothetical protein